MQYASISGIDRPVSRIFFGSSMPVFLQGKNDFALLDGMVSLGINAIDTARVYGKAEDCLGEWMAERGNRKDLILLSKCAHHDQATMRKRVTPQDMRADLAVSLSLLKTDFIDIYLLHRDDTDVPVGPIVETFNEMHADGKIGIFGASNWSHERTEEANEYAYAHGLEPFRFSSPNFGLARQCSDPWGGGALTISGPENQEARDWYRKNGMPLAAYSSLGHGFFSGKLKSGDSPERALEILDPNGYKGYACEDNFLRLARAEELSAAKGVTVPQIAMSWMFRQNLDVFAIVSTSSVQRMQANIDALSLELTDAECRYLNLED